MGQHAAEAADAFVAAALAGGGPMVGTAVAQALHMHMLPNWQMPQGAEQAEEEVIAVVNCHSSWR